VTVEIQEESWAKRGKAAEAWLTLRSRSAVTRDNWALWISMLTISMLDAHEEKRGQGLAWVGKIADVVYVDKRKKSRSEEGERRVYQRRSTCLLIVLAMKPLVVIEGRRMSIYGR
jgi:hypothetical protein